MGRVSSPAETSSRSNPACFGALAGFDVHVDHAADVELIHFAAVHRARGEYRRQPLARGAAELARLERRRIAAAVPQLNPGKAAVLVRHIAHVAQVDHVSLIPDARGGVGILVRFGMDGAELREHGAPAALGLHAAQMRLGAGSFGAGPGAMRGLPESIAERLRADLDGLEQARRASDLGT